MRPELLQYPVRMFREYQENVADELHLLAERHAAHDPNLVALSPADAPDVSIFPPRLKGNPLPAEAIDGIADLATQGRFPAVLDSLAAAQEETGLITRLGESLQSRKNVMIVTNHGEIADVAIALAGFYSHLKKRDYQPKTGIVISRMVSLLGYKIGDDIMPATTVLKMLCNDLYLSFPRTDSMSAAKIPEPLVKTYNRGIRYSVGWNLTKGRHMMAVAASGTTDKPLEGDPNTIGMARLTHGTLEMLMKNAEVVPVAVWLKGPEPIFEICDQPQKIESEDQAHALMEGIAATLNQKVQDKKFLYRPAA